MAKLGYMGPFRGRRTLAPGQAEWVAFGRSTGFGDSAIAVAPQANAGTGGRTHVLKVDNVNVIAVQGAGEIPSMDYEAGCNVTNNGRTTITDWSVMVGVIQAG